MHSRVVNIVGNGLAGSLAARVLRARGRGCRVFDSNSQYSASKASSNLFIASWLKKFASKEAANGVKVLEELFSDVIDQPFSNGLSYAMKVRHVAQRYVLVEPDVRESATPLDGGVVTPSGSHYPGTVVLCRGYDEPLLDLKVKVGHCLLFKGQLPKGKSRVAIISPYRHEKLYQYDDDTIYYADSVAVALKTYTKREYEYRAKTLSRARAHLEPLGIKTNFFEFRVGYRPIMKSHDFGKLTQHEPGVWTMNGGGKNGLVAYSHLADQLAKELI